MRKNVAWSLVLTVVDYMFPLLVYMHVSRALGVTGIGLVGFIDGVVTYFILFSMMGITMLGVRTMAKYCHDPERLCGAFRSLFRLHAIFTLAILGLMAAATWIVPELRANASMMGIGMCKLVLNVLLAEWFFIGTEQFRFMAVRNLAVKTLYLTAVLLLVSSPEDTTLYYGLTMGVVAAIAAANMGKIVREFRGVKSRRGAENYVGSFFSLGVFAVCSGTWLAFSMAFLGFADDSAAVGYFSTSSRVVVIITGIFAALAGVVGSRASRYFAQGERQPFTSLAKKSTGWFLLLGALAGGLAYLFAPELVLALSGAGYEGAVEPLRLMSPFIVVMAMGKQLTAQFMVPASQEKCMAASALAGMSVCILLCAWLIPAQGVNGAVYAWTGAETAAFLVNLGFALRNSGFVTKMV